jgi:hypothetical protein
MSEEREILQRVTRLETQLLNEQKEREREVSELKAEVAELEKKLNYYDKAALKWGGFCMGMIVLGGFIWAGVDKVVDKVIALAGRIP